MENSREIEKSIPINLAEIIEYEANAVVTKTVLNKTTGNICLMAFDIDKGQSEKTSPFDAFVQIIEGEANIFIGGNSNILKAGQSIVIPAHAANYVKPNGRFKMMVTTIKSGY